MTLAVLYRWTLKPGKEDQFREGWTRGTRAIHDRCGSFGARLHRAADGTYVSYALWPDDATRKACMADNDFSGEGFDQMRDASAEYHGEETMEILDDLVAGP